MRCIFTYITFYVHRYTVIYIFNIYTKKKNAKYMKKGHLFYAHKQILLSNK